MAKRQPGAQKGNLNAYKHGFYSPHFNNTENVDLEAYLSTGLDSEVAMLSVFTRPVFELADGIQNFNEVLVSHSAQGTLMRIFAKKLLQLNQYC